MKLVEIDERDRRAERIYDSGIWWDGKELPVCRYPLYAGILPGEPVSTGYPGQILVAPSAPGVWELWHVTVDGSHARWEFRRSE